MNTPVHQAGMMGYLPRDMSRYALTLEDFLDDGETLPTAPGVVDRASKVINWPMYCNDALGCCTIAGMAHAFGAMTAFSGQVNGGSMFTDAQITEYYSRIGGYVVGEPETDKGATLAAVCQDVVKNGWQDASGMVHRLAGWAEIANFKNVDLLKQVLYTFGSVYLAFQLPTSAETQFNSGLPWTVVAGSPNGGGHCTCLQVNRGPVLDNETVITWGAEQEMNIAFAQRNLVEAIAPVSQDFVQMNGKTINGMNLQGLLNLAHMVE